MSEQNPLKYLSEFTKVFDAILRDFSESDKQFIIRQIDDAMSSDVFRNPKFHTISYIPSSIYLLAKCPANSDMPLSLRQIKKRVESYAPRPQHPIHRWRKTISSLKRANIFQDCKITPKYLIMSSLNVFFGYMDNLTDEDKQETIDMIASISDDPQHRMAFMGKSPYVLAGAILYYICRIKKYPVTQIRLAQLFSVTEVAIRNRFGQLREIYKETIIEPKHSSHSPITLKKINTALKKTTPALKKPNPQPKPLPPKESFEDTASDFDKEFIALGETSEDESQYIQGLLRDLNPLSDDDIEGLRQIVNNWFKNVGLEDDTCLACLLFWKYNCNNSSNSNICEKYTRLSYLNKPEVQQK